MTVVHFLPAVVTNSADVTTSMGMGIPCISIAEKSFLSQVAIVMPFAFAVASGITLETEPISSQHLKLS